MNVGKRAGRDGDLEHARDLIVGLTEAAEATESGLSRALEAPARQ
jgi:hypothetical protein